METDREIKNIVNKIKNYLANKYGIDKIKKDVILYGSHARGKAKEASDIDVLVVMDDSLDPLEVRMSLSETILDIMLDKEELVSLLSSHKISSKGIDCLSS